MDRYRLPYRGNTNYISLLQDTMCIQWSNDLWLNVNVALFEYMKIQWLTKNFALQNIRIMEQFRNNKINA